MKRAVRRFRPGEDEASEDEETDRTEHDLLDALKNNPVTRQLDLSVSALGGGLVELTGTVPDETTRELAADVARGVLGADVVVNRILVEGTDTDGQSAVVS
jgi:osmotically-inducible protein OsmY